MSTPGGDWSFWSIAIGGGVVGGIIGALAESFSAYLLDSRREQRRERKELIAAQMSVEDIRRHIGADSLEYLDMKNLVRAVGLPRGNFCTACFDERYPIPLDTDVKISKYDLEEQKAAAG